MIAKLEGHTGLERKNMSAPEIIEPTRGISGEEVSWTPDSKYVLGGSLEGRIFIWDLRNLPHRSEMDRKLPHIRLVPLVALENHPEPPAMC